MLAAADLAGYIDTWILRGPREQANGTSDHDDDDGSASSDDSSDEEDPGAKDRGWIRNPRASLIPKLSSPPAVLSFSDEIPGPGARVNGEESGGYTLLAVMASMQILVFNPLRGALGLVTSKCLREATGAVQEHQGHRQGRNLARASRLDLRTNLPVHAGSVAGSTPGRRIEGWPQEGYQAQARPGTAEPEARWTTIPSLPTP